MRQKTHYVFRHGTERMSSYAIMDREQPPRVQAKMVESLDPDDAPGTVLPFVWTPDMLMLNGCTEGFEHEHGLNLRLPLGGYQALSIVPVGPIVYPGDLVALARGQKRNRSMPPVDGNGMYADGIHAARNADVLKRISDATTIKAGLTILVTAVGEDGVTSVKDGVSVAQAEATAAALLANDEVLFRALVNRTTYKDF